ncbi:hypothetical protein ACFOY8_15445 [Thalassospira xianhensis]|uniref:Uncharacterized protein n=1 Tax=Thalassospira xianhensis MCCC 1A02616 TaxID=1177929 RepID=A0A367UAN7_9PROT|nr:hypothetical protein [Thalassospira xianhensis]RCK04092.1 hypothetical protein TH5_21635 [Thalassospira xianhensis MCCC 1A02616]
MKFSEFFDVDYTDDLPWFDPLLTIDTKLFIDPFLIFQNEFGPFVGAHNELVEYFNEVFEIMASANNVPRLRRKATNLLKFPEMEELMLGYTAFGTRGGGTGTKKAELIAAGIERAINFSIMDSAHFETIQLLQEGIGPDLISDATGNILRHRFADYTESVCKEHGITAIQRSTYVRGKFNTASGRWEQQHYNLPHNPWNKKPILLCPKDYLRPLPTLNPDDYWGFCCDFDSKSLREEFGDDIKRNVKKEIILEKAIKDFSSVESFVRFIEKIGGTPYDMEKDPKGLIKWYNKTKEFALSNPQELSFSSSNTFNKFIFEICEIFKNYIENQGGWQLIYNDNGRPKSEEASQFSFLGIVTHYCRANNIDLSREVNIGRGPVDFKTSQGSEKKALLELKLASNTKFWNGPKKQLKKYLEAENIDYGVFVVIVHTEKELEKIKDLRKIVNEINSNNDFTIDFIVVEAEFKPASASRLI